MRGILQKIVTVFAAVIVASVSVSAAVGPAVDGASLVA